MTDKLNIVLVHGAFGDGSHWRHIIPGLYRAGHRAMAAQNPLTSLADDVANTRKLAEWMGGPTLLVGHSYGGAVITGGPAAELRTVCSSPRPVMPSFGKMRYKWVPIVRCE